MNGFLSAGGEHSVIRLDPRTKLYTLLVFSLITFPAATSVADGYLKLTLASCAFLILLNIRKPGLAVGYGVIYLMAYFGDRLLQYMSGVSVLGTLIRIVIVLVLRMLPSVIAAWSFLQTTKVSEFVAAMERMHVTPKITIPFAVLFRFFPTVADEYHSIRDAMKMRGVGITKGPAAMLEYRLVPLIVSIVKIGDELSAAAVSRGLGGSNKRTNYCRIGFVTGDIFLILLLTAALIASCIF